MIRKGLAAIKDDLNNSASQFKLKKDGDHAIIRVLTPADEIISVYEHVEQFGDQWYTITCLGKDECPLCQVGHKPSYRVYMVIANRSEGDKIQYFKANKKTARQIIGLIEEYGDITKRDFKIVRQGEGFDTLYQFFPKDPSEFKLPENAFIPDLEELVKPMSKEAIINLMQTGGFGQPSGDSQDGDDDFPF